MRTGIIGMLAVAAVAFGAKPAEAKVVALYASGQGGVQQSAAENSPGLGLEVGARVLILDAYLDYMSFGQSQSVARAVAGLRAGIGSDKLRLVLRAGLGAIREDNGALHNVTMMDRRTGGVARAGAGLDWRIERFLYLGFMIDAETFVFPGAQTVALGSMDVPSSYQWGGDVFGALKVTFELGI
jgi:hypothetical protein